MEANIIFEVTTGSLYESFCFVLNENAFGRIYDRNLIFLTNLCRREKKWVKYIFRLQKGVKNENPIIAKCPRPETWVADILQL